MSKKNPMPNARRLLLTKAVEKRRQELLDQVRAVAQGYTTALFVYGPGGLGKTHHITDALDGLCGNGWMHHTAYSTPKALFLSLYESPHAIHLFEDCERLYKIDVASSILRAACGAPRGGPRRITYETANESLTCTFTGGIIIVSNESLERRASGPLKAVASRFRPTPWNLSWEERMALIKNIAITLTGERCLGLEKPDRVEVADFMIEEMSKDASLRVDLRTFTEHGLPTFSQWKNGDLVSHWKDVLLAKMRGGSVQLDSREERERAWEDLAHSIWMSEKLADNPAKLAWWSEQTGMAQAQYYRYLKQAKAKRQLVK